MLRTVLALIAGLFAGVAVNLGGTSLVGALFPPPPGVRLEDPAALAAYVAALPVAALLLVMAAHLGQAFVGGAVAAAIGPAPMRLALVIGGLSLVGGTVNLLSLPHPPWMWVELPLYLVFAWAAGKIAQQRRAAA
jgi:hypothetical protein